MTFDDLLAQVLDLLQRDKRLSYRALKRRFALDDDYLEDLKEELIHAKRLAVDEDGRVLVWASGVVTPEPAPTAPRQHSTLIPRQTSLRQLHRHRQNLPSLTPNAAN
jgi:hypothetical protein